MGNILQETKNKVLDVEKAVIKTLIELKEKIENNLWRENEGTASYYTNLSKGETIETQCIKDVINGLEILQKINDPDKGIFININEKVEFNDDALDDEHVFDIEFYNVNTILKMLDNCENDRKELLDFKIKYFVSITQYINNIGQWKKEILEIKIVGKKISDIGIEWKILDELSLSAYATPYRLIQIGDYYVDDNFNYYTELDVVEGKRY